MENQKDNNYKKDNFLSDLRRNTDLFHGDQNLYILYRRIQNIVAALFLVTSELDDTEVLKSSLRDIGLTSISQAVNLIKLDSSDHENLRALAASVYGINSLLSIGFWAGIITEMNMIILQKEITKIEKNIHDLISSYETKYLISSNLFKGVDDFELEAKENGKRQYKGHYIKDNLKDIFKQSNAPVIKPQEQQSVSENKIDRRQEILKLLAERSNLSIKDFSQVIPSYSEKTIQRELLALVEEGIVKREGERRWSTYTLVQ